MFIQLLTENPVYYVSALTSVVLSVTLHELGHVFAALRQGDDTPRVMGRVTLDPMVHMGPMSLAMAALLGLAWGVTPVNPSAFRGRHGRAWVALAGPAVNLLLALIALTTLALLAKNADPSVLLGRNNLFLFLTVLGALNILLFLFNMLPIPPLDGATVLADLSPGFDRLHHQPEAQPWFLSALFAAIILLPLHETAIRLATLYVQLWM